VADGIGGGGGGGGLYGGGGGASYSGGAGGSSYADPATFSITSQDLTTTGPMAKISYAASPSSLTIGAPDASLQADGVSHTIVEMVLLDQTGRAWPDQDVTVSTSGPAVVLSEVQQGIGQFTGHYFVDVRAEHTVGTVTVTASFDGMSQSTTIDIVKLDQTLWSPTSQKPAVVGQARAVGFLAGESGKPVVLSATGAACTLGNISGGSATAHFVHVGTCTITATQAGTAVYNAATPLSLKIAVKKGPQALRITSKPGKARAGTTYRLKTSGAARGAKVSYTAGPRVICSLSGGSSVKLRLPGPCAVTATASATKDYASAKATQKFTVKR
jgi:hypothetical protein